MKSLIFGLCGVFALGSLAAQKGGWEPSPGHKQVPIWPVAAPDPQPVRGPEVVEPSGNTFLVAGREVIGVSNVTRPTMTVYSPRERIPASWSSSSPAGAIRLWPSTLKAQKSVTG